jgi:ADP-ribose pyrophosphatase
MKRPEGAKKVFSGVSHSVYHWNQEMFDGSFETFETIDRADSAQVVAISDGKILIAQEQQPAGASFYTLPGGRIDNNEDVESCAKRELLEETGYESNDWEFMYSYSPSSKMDWEINTYIARDCKKVADQKLDAGEKIEVLRVDFDQFEDVVFSDHFRDKGFTMKLLKMKFLDEEKYEEFKQKLGI